MNSIQKTSLLVMAAGLGSRYGGDKQIDRIGPDGEILMQYSIFDAIKAGFDKIVIVIKPSYRELLEKLLAPIRSAGIELYFVYQDFSTVPSSYKIPSQRNKPFGTVHAVLCAKDVIKEPFAVINADDFYGRGAFSAIHDALLTIKESEGAMVAYDLKNTVSPNGSVTRGICNISDGYLSSITETYSISLKPDGSIEDIKLGSLDKELPVSMNMWGFGPWIFEPLEKSFEDFLSGIEPNDIKAEYVIPSFVDSQIKSNKLKIRVMKTFESWFGVTYAQDRDSVAQKLKAMKEDGSYPTKLSLK